MSNEPWTLTARWIFPASATPIEHGTITIRGPWIESVAPPGQRSPDFDLGEAAVLPGFVNAHTHLDLTGMRGLCPPTPNFPEWLRNVRNYRGTRTPEQIQDDIRRGLAECLRTGTTLLGDISSQGWSWPILTNSDLLPRATVFYEVLGLSAERADAARQALLAWLEQHPAAATCRPGISPHAPYSVRRSLFAECAVLSQKFACPVQVHLGESRPEMELLETRTGPFVDFLKDLGVWDEQGLIGSPEEIFDFFGPSLTAVHGNHLEPRPGKLLAYCPRTHAAFEHPEHPFREWLAEGGKVVLGTDSLASNPDLDILAEARFLAGKYPDLPGSTLLRMFTVDAAGALGFGAVAGSLEAGKSADLVVIPLRENEAADPHRRFLDSDLPVRAVLLRGQWVVLERGAGN